jgi:Tfp pilus assembly protein PilF
MNSFFRHTLLLCLFLLALSSGASKTIYKTSPSPIEDYRALQSYTLATYYYFDGNYAAADKSYKKSLKYDPDAPAIKKQLLLNAFALYQSKGISAKKLQKLIDDYTKETLLDEDLLYAAYDFYNYNQNEAELLKIIDELRTRYPSPRAYIQSFLFELQYHQKVFSEYLSKAQELAGNNPTYYPLLIRLWSLFNPEMEKQAILRYYELDKGAQANSFLAEYIVRNRDLELANQYLSSLHYPEDKDYILFFASAQWSNQPNPLLPDLADFFLRTSDLELISELALSALIQHRWDLFPEIQAAVEASYAPEEEKQSLYSLLIAYAIYTSNDMSLSPILEKLTELKYFDAIFIFYSCAVNQKIDPDVKLPAAEDYEHFINEIKKRLPDEPPARYLQAIASPEIEDSEPLVLDSKYILALWLREHHTLLPEDYEFIISYCHLKKNFPEERNFLMEAINKWPDHPSFYNDLGYSILINGEDPEQAANLIRKALTYEPENPYFLDSLAWYYYLNGNYPEALHLMSIPQKMDNMPAEIAWHLGAIHLALRNYKDARIWLQKCLTINNDPEVEELAKKALKQIPE